MPQTKIYEWNLMRYVKIEKKTNFSIFIFHVPEEKVEKNKWKNRRNIDITTFDLPLSGHSTILSPPTNIVCETFLAERHE